MILSRSVPAVIKPEKNWKTPHLFRLTVWIGLVEDFVTADVSHRRIPADLQTVEGRVDHLQVLYSTHRIWTGGGVKSLRMKGHFNSRSGSFLHRISMETWRKITSRCPWATCNTGVSVQLNQLQSTHWFSHFPTGIFPPSQDTPAPLWLYIQCLDQASEGLWRWCFLTPASLRTEQRWTLGFTEHLSRTSWSKERCWRDMWVSCDQSLTTLGSPPVVGTHVMTYSRTLPSAGSQRTLSLLVVGS